MFFRNFHSKSYFNALSLNINLQTLYTVMLHGDMIILSILLFLYSLILDPFTNANKLKRAVRLKSLFIYSPHTIRLINRRKISFRQEGKESSFLLALKQRTQLIDFRFY